VDLVKKKKKNALQKYFGTYTSLRQTLPFIRRMKKTQTVSLWMSFD